METTLEQGHSGEPCPGRSRICSLNAPNFHEVNSGAQEDITRTGHRRAGGRVLVQDPASAEWADMPRAAIATGCVDFILPLDQIARALIALIMVRGAADYFQVAIPHWALLA